MPDEKHIAIAVLESTEGYVLQRRPDEEGVGEAGKIGCFGGKVKAGERPQDAAAREVHEEAGLKLPSFRYSYLGIVNVEADSGDGELVEIKAQVYTAYIGRTVLAETVREGEVVVVPAEDVDQLLHEMTPATRAVFNELYTSA